MAETALLYPPVGVLKPVAPEVWIVDGPAVTLSLLGMDFAFPTRMTVVRLCDGGLWCHSPVAYSEELDRELRAIGRVRHLVSPNKLHYLHITDWQHACPDAVAWASPGVRRRSARQGHRLRFDRELGESSPVPWAGEIEQHLFRGSRLLQELVFFHRASASLVLTDLIQNFELQKLQPHWRWLVKLAGASDPDGRAPLDLRLSFWGHHAQARASRDHLLAWQPERVIIAHGRWYERDGTRELERAFRWLD